MANADPISILLIEDDEVDVMAVERTLSRSGVPHRLFRAENGCDALEQLRGGQLPATDLILLDLNMPRMGGLEFLRRLRADPALASTPAFVLTTSSRSEDMEESERLGAAGYFLKDQFSSDPGQLQQLLRRFRELSQARAQAETPRP